MADPFNFFHHWYPVTPVADLRPDYPTAVTVLGVPIVIWKPRNSDTYRAFLDQCPHRLAPLSEGRVDEQSGHLMCSYHGWQFDSKGLCQALPQAEADFQPDQRSQLCATVLPSQTKNDLLWIWPDAASADIAHETPLPLSAQVDASKGFVWDSYVRDLEYDWQTLVENVVDPSHVSFAHHGVQGNRANAAPLPIKILHSTVERIEAQSKGRFKSHLTFEPPCRVEYELTFGDSGKQVGLVTYCIPTVPGKCRIVAQFPRNFALRLHQVVPRWWSHVTMRNAVLDGDMVLLQQQQQRLQRQLQIQDWKTAYKLPTSADRFVIEFRKWCDLYLQNQPFGEVPMPALAPAAAQNHRQMLDRYHQHTQHCQSCRSALKTIRRLQWGLLIFFVVSLTVVAVLPDSLRLWPGLLLMGLGLVGLGGAAGLRFVLEPKFLFVDYIHAERK
ncbi:aromatic ring-hydroxylating dioxygenase subunit alpha [Leptothoe spongobia]|uniref:Rieske 2Fe-2S domain-containing protein n=1 Tax=Leptothoe spongobia TAU-MAC 1115 TaxID=1967444 RepID=A0A947DGB4_9CYAN|nr:Rieske 2Fe-2S domain-containing protein [Leptothoe spongobia]MBT9316336.1 Rieske 2Fe-2S domain-containing protein [Leptothoe spongobia TAU-MAC 1115]